MQYEEQRAHLPLFVLKGEGPSLFGRNWLECVRLDWKRIHQVHGSSLQDVLYRHQEVFGEELGMLKGYEAKIHIDAGATPRFCHARPVPYAISSGVAARWGTLGHVPQQLEAVPHRCSADSSVVDRESSAKWS